MEKLKTIESRRRDVYIKIRGWEHVQKEVEIESKETKWKYANKILSASTLTIVDLSNRCGYLSLLLPFYYSSTIVITRVIVIIFLIIVITVLLLLWRLFNTRNLRVHK